MKDSQLEKSDMDSEDTGRAEVDQDPYRVQFVDRVPEVSVHGCPEALCHASLKTNA